VLEEDVRFLFESFLVIIKTSDKHKILPIAMMIKKKIIHDFLSQYELQIIPCSNLSDSLG
jgi:hypothetical protein